jgi:hypothetical protein
MSYKISHFVIPFIGGLVVDNIYHRFNKNRYDKYPKVEKQLRNIEGILEYSYPCDNCDLNLLTKEVLKLSDIIRN